MKSVNSFFLQIKGEKRNPNELLIDFYIMFENLNVVIVDIEVKKHRKEFDLYNIFVHCEISKASNRLLKEVSSRALPVYFFPLNKNIYVHRSNYERNDIRPNLQLMTLRHEIRGIKETLERYDMYFQKLLKR
jgi:hypothetical protein